MDQTELKWLAVIGIKAEIARLGMLVKELEGEMIEAPVTRPLAIERSNDSPRPRRHMSKAAKAKISARMKKYWAEKRD